jgi:ATP-dependent DNA helicase RecG
MVSALPISPLTLPVTALPGVGKRQAEKLARLEIRTVEDLLVHYPVRWVDRREIRPLAEVTPLDAYRTESGEDGRERRAAVTVLGTVVGVRLAGPPFKRRRGGALPSDRLEVVIREGAASASLVFFGGGWRRSHFEPGGKVLVSGPVSLYRDRIQFQNPDYESLSDDEEAALHTGRHFPVYPLTRGLTQRQLRGWVRDAMERVFPETPDPFPPAFRERFRLMEKGEALRDYHFPPSERERDQARRRLAFEEVLLDQLFMQAVRLRRETGKVAPVVRGEGPLFRRIRGALPFTLTPDQERALAEILGDLGGRRPMNRLLQGDVGSGKTVVAFLAAAAAADSGLQTAIMVPTEILAEQHVRSLRALGADLGLEARLLSGSQSRPARREVLRALADGTAPLVVGTHALFQEDVRFFRLGLVVVDEQHRFGVLQRVALLEKGASPHVLVMSATPIPRSMALVRYADLDLSVLAQRPRGRGKVTTRVTPEANRDKVYAFMADRLREGRQAYVIYPLVEESDKMELRAATTMARTLAARPEFQGFTVALLHGQMRGEEKDAVMSRFVRGEIQALVATTVIEVGIDVANATFVLIEHPERYGLSQLHQLRGRVGRGVHDSYCVLVAGSGVDPASRERLERFAKTDDGFELARLDLLLRGPGDLVGTRQSGRPGFKLADPVREVKMVQAAQDEAKHLLESGVLTAEGGAEWNALRERLRTLLEAHGALVEIG